MATVFTTSSFQIKSLSVAQNYRFLFETNRTNLWFKDTIQKQFEKNGIKISWSKKMIEKKIYDVFDLSQNDFEIETMDAYLLKYKSMLHYNDALQLTINLADELGSIQEEHKRILPYLLLNKIICIQPAKFGGKQFQTWFLYISPDSFLNMKENGKADFDLTVKSESPFIPQDLLTKYRTYTTSTISSRRIEAAAAAATSSITDKDISRVDTVESTTWLYSLAQIITFAITNESKLNEPKNIVSALEPLELTKLAFALRRCIDEDVSKRIFLII